MKKKKLNYLILTSTLLLGVPAALVSCGNKSNVDVVSTYKVSVGSVVGGTATVNVDKSEAKKGETITISISNIESGKQVSSVKAGSLDVTTVVENSSYTFVMGEENVEVVVTLSEIPASKYALSFVKNEHVSATFKVNDVEVSEAAEGETVVINLTFEDKYALASEGLTAEGITFTAIEEGVLYSFTMPNKAVSISAETNYVKENYIVKSVNYYSDYYSYYYQYYTSGISVFDQILEGEEVTLTINNYYEFIEDKYDVNLYINGEKTATFAPTDEEGYTYTCSFVMPAENIDVAIAEDLKSVSEGITVSWEDSDLFSIYGISNGAIVSSSSSSLKLWVKANQGAKINSVKFYGDNEEKELDVEDSGNGKYSMYLDTNSSLLTNNKITVKVDAEEVGTKAVTIANSENVTITGNFGSYTPGEKVSFKVSANEGYSLKTGYNAIKNVNSSDESITVSSLDSYLSDGILSFTMPNADIEITLNVNKLYDISGTTDEIITGWTFKNGSSYNSDEITSASAGDTIYIYPTVKSGYYVTGVKVNDVEADVSDINYGYASYTLPSDLSSEIKVEATYRQCLEVTYSESAAYAVSGLSSNYKVGDAVTFSVVPNAGYSIKSVTRNDTGETLTPTSGSTNYSFILGESNVHISILTETVETKILTFAEFDSSKFSGYILNGNNQEVSSGDKVNVGDTIEVHLTPVVGTNITSVKLNDVALTEKEGSNNVFVGVMPSVDATLVIETESAASDTVTLSFDSKISSLSSVYSGDSSIPVSDNTFNAVVGSEYSVTFKILDSKNYSYKEDNIVVKSGNLILSSGYTVTVDSIFDFSSYSDIPTITFKFTMVEAPLTIELTPSAKEKYAVNVTSDKVTSSVITFGDDGYDDTVVYESGHTITEGTKVYIYFNVSSLDFNSNSYALYVKDAEGNVVAQFYDYSAWSYQDYYTIDDYSSSTSFEMPSKAVYISIVVTAK